MVVKDSFEALLEDIRLGISENQKFATVAMIKRLENLKIPGEKREEEGDKIRNLQKIQNLKEILKTLVD